MRVMRELLLDQVGASAAEYALILAVIGGAIAISALALGVSITNALTRSSDAINDCGGGC